MSERVGSGTGSIARRTVLRGIAASGVAGGLTATVPTAGAHGDCGDITVDPDSGEGDHSSIQAAVDAANPGDSICVRAGTYHEDVDVDKAVVVFGAHAPESSPSLPGSGSESDAATVAGRLKVSGVGATVRRLRISPTMEFDPSVLEAAGVLVTAGDTTLAENLIEDVTGDATGTSGSYSLHGIQVFGGDPNTADVNVTVENNVVRNVRNDGAPSQGWPHYGGAVGIKVQGNVDDVTVSGNTVNGVHSAGWSYGIVTTASGNAPQDPPENVLVEKNRVDTVTDRSVFPNAVYEGVGFAVDEVTYDNDASQSTVTLNDFVNTPTAVLNKDDENTLSAECNWYGHPTGPAADDNPLGQGNPVAGDVDYRPWSIRPFRDGPYLEQVSCRGDLPSPPVEQPQTPDDAPEKPDLPVGLPVSAD